MQYFAWVGLYTKWLMGPALLGVITFGVTVQDMRNAEGDETITINGIIIMTYSIYLALVSYLGWAAYFLLRYARSGWFGACDPLLALR